LEFAPGAFLIAVAIEDLGIFLQGYLLLISPLERERNIETPSVFVRR
jgi:hypothetical protein